MIYKKIINSMNKISVKITTFLFLFTISALILNSVFNSIIISKYFSEIENDTLIPKTEQVEKVFESQIKNMNSIVQDYAIWDDIYSKMQDETIDNEWLDINYSQWLSEKLDIDLIIIADKNKNIILNYGLNSSNGTESIINDDTISKLFDEETYNENICKGGFKVYGADIYLVSACPIFKTTTEGTSKGVVILGRKITPKFIANIQEQFGMDIFISYDDKLVTGPNYTEEQNEDILMLIKNMNSSIYNVYNSMTVINTPIMDISKNEIGKINLVQSREIYLSTHKLMQRNSLLVMIISSLLLFVLGYKFKDFIVNPIKTLESQIKDMESNNLLAPIYVNGPNEIMSLAESFNHMIDSICSHKKENEVLKIKSNTDPLTGAYNHKYYFESLNSLIANCNRQISVLFCDIDKFKLTNDTYGHEAGDLLLIEIAKILKDQIKDDGLVFRYGGEEFVATLCGFNSTQAYIEAEKIRKTIASSKFLQKYSDFFPITVSIGIASYPNYGLDAETLVKNADTAMYYSKQNGRNQCTIYTDELENFFEDCQFTARKELLIDSTLSLAEAVDAKDHYTGKHSKMVAKYSILMAEKLNFTEDDKNKLRIGALLHDCGKIGIPDNIINKPDRLSDDEYAIIKNHTILGNNIIKHITNDEKIIYCIRSHHERWDGKGYPDELSETSISLFARIVCIADALHSMTSDRPYRKALSKEKVIGELLKGKGTQFDPSLVDIAIEIVKLNDN